MFKDTWRRIRAMEWLRQFGCWMVAQYMGVVWATGRWEMLHPEIPERFWAKDQAFVMGFWHNRLLMLPPMWPKTKSMNVLISRHRDGELIAKAISYFGIHTVRGSATNPRTNRDKGGALALRGMLKLLKAGHYVAISPDGPRGPRMRAREGILTVARLSGAPIVPCAYSTSRRAVTGSWDRFIIPLPFSRGVVAWGEPIYIAREMNAAELETVRYKVEAALSAVANEADAAAGVAPIEPDPLPKAVEKKMEAVAS